MRKIASLLFALALGSVFADEAKPVRTAEVTPPAGPRVVDWSDFYVTGEFIWWNARQDGLSYVAGGRNTVAGVKGFQGHKEYVSSDYQPGFKVGFGFNFRHDGWDLYANYTWLNPARHGGHTPATEHTGQLVSSWSFPVPASPATALPALSAGARWMMHFNVLDSELGRNFYLSTKLSMRPFMGFKGAWINQRYRAHYVVDPSFNLSYARMKNHQHFTGFGIRAGIGSSWKIGNMWYLYGSGAFSALWSQFDNHRRDRLVNTNGATFLSYNIEDDYRNLTPVVELGLGLQYIHDWRDGKKRFTFQIGWEEQIWFNHNRFLNQIFENNGSLTLQGLTGKITYAW